MLLNHCKIMSTRFPAGKSSILYRWLHRDHKKVITEKKQYQSGWQCVSILDGHLILVTTIACRISGWVGGRLQAFKVIIIITVHGTSTVKLNFVWRLSSTHPEKKSTNEIKVKLESWMITRPSSPFQEIFQIGLCHLSSKLACLGHLTQHCLNLKLESKTGSLLVWDCLLPLLRFGQLDCVQPGSCFLIQHLHNLCTH